MGNKPRIRFKGFTEDWEQRKLGNLYKRVNERNDGTLGRDKWISVAKMYFQDPDKVQSNNLDTRTYVMKKGDIAFEGHPNNEFKFGRFVLNDIGTGIISELFPIYRPITEYDLDFWKYAIQLERVMAPIFAKSITSSGNSSNKLDHNHFLNQELLVPNIDEQKKIGTLLSILSKNITLHQCKLEKLKLTKKALLQKFFPKNGKRIPEIRFKGFTDAWEQRKFLDLLDAQNGIRRGPFGSSLKKNSFVKKSDYVVYEQQNAIYDNYETRYFISKEKYNELIRFNIQPGDFIMSGAGTIGRISMVPDGIKKGVFNQALIRFKVNKDSINPLYFLKFMQSDMMQKQLTQANPGSAMTNLVPMDELKKWDVTIPSLEEQNRISTFINQIDAFITLHQRKLERLQEVKKGLLQKMFV